MLISGHKYESVWENIGSCKIWESNDQKLLGVSIDSNLKSNHYISKQCKKAGTKLSAITRICKLMSLRRRRVLMRTLLNLSLHTVPYGCVVMKHLIIV